MSDPIKKDSKINGGDSMSQKTNEDFNKKKPVAGEPDFLPPIAIPPEPIIDAMKDMEKAPPQDPIIK
jgi:hypothetical protein